MKASKVVRALGPIDIKSVRRDSMMSWMVVIPIIMALILRFGIPSLSERILTLWGFDLKPYYMLVVSYFVIMMVPLVYGVVIGFLLLDQRDDRTLTAFQVSPLSVSGYFMYRIAMPMVLSVVMSVAAFYLVGLIEMNLWLLLIAVIGAAPLAPLYVLYMADFAEDKVKGFALVKATGPIVLGPIIAYFIKMPWQLLLGIFPPYWPVKFFWMGYQGQSGAWLYWLIGFGYLALLVGVLLRRFNRVVYR